MIALDKIPDGPSVPEGFLGVGYGTSGFRSHAEGPINAMDHVAYRCGLIFAAMPLISRGYPDVYSEYLLKSKDSDSEVIGMGCVITASHNPYQDNGVKLFTPSGEMLESEWEQLMDEFVNTKGSVQELLKEYLKVSQGFKEHLETFRKRYSIRIIVGYDSRSTSPRLVSFFKKGVNAVLDALELDTSECIVIGKVTTPTLPFLLNNGYASVSSDSVYLDYIEGVFSDVVQKFTKFGLLKETFTIDTNEELYYDCSFGVSSFKIWRFCNCIRLLGMNPYVCNSSIPGDPSEMFNRLNAGCGSDYVMSKNTVPQSVKDMDIYIGKRFCSFDGDADRVIYFVPGRDGQCTVFHGDHILLVKLLFLRSLLKDCTFKLSVGVLQTRYSNGAITAYIHSLISKWNSESSGIEWHHEFFNSGVKHAQRAAKKYDLSVYYEKNGHGAIVSRVNTFESTCSCLNELSSKENNGNREILSSVLRLFYPGGDAIVNSLVFELALKVLDMSIYDCVRLYTDLPFMNTRYEIPKHIMTRFSTSIDNDSVLVRPKEFQESLESQVQLYDGARAFVRPSGTENILRIYVEANSEDVVKVLYDFIIEGIERALNDTE
ncbi:phosphoacetylglucosamine mutase, putative [Theileria equi strain WA]|uniref:Phosphoacetylglucosamine mutase, putative n=1 Tax=Theileria equi strain WA TaxID=1537102 RepID=L1LDC2_THEEQ|nr:phosphoacetylglucosamine mutase, putative [Theileria equi strain WA]EKX73447.1 phosphoacetylglucosamine mutase, putative [Theileria equi strain WA]|eukprot:XP_004832899.1 phosphoacetylglucosamine mutase, putative [Theileria equi strain WA]